MCNFDKEPTAAILAFEGIVLASTAVLLPIFRRLDPKVIVRYVTIAVGVLIFEMFTAPMWHNHHLGVWAYVYHDVSWILTLGWTTMILTVLFLVDRHFTGWGPVKRFAASIGILTALVLVAELAVVNLGIRSYAPEVEDTVIGVYVAGVPLEAVYYIPVFMALVVGFYRYWALVIDDEPLVPVVRRRWMRSLGITAVAVLLFELMIEPMVVNAGFPSWSYVYRDITFLMTGVWIVLIALSTNLVDKFLFHIGLKARFVAYIAIVGLLALPIESWLIKNGFREYGATATADFTGIVTPITGVPVEVAFAIPLYMALIVAFSRYWEIVAENRR